MPTGNISRRQHPCRRVRAAAQLADGLYIVQVLKRMVEVRQIKGLSKRQWRNGFANIVELLNATHAAAGTPGQRAAALFQPHKAAAGEFDLHFKAVAGLHHVHAVDLLRMLNDAFREGKPMANSSRSFGEAIITTCEIPL
jgi:hypothetical protein